MFLCTFFIHPECTYDSTGKDEATIAGLTTNQEMCLAFLWFYTTTPRNSTAWMTCSSYPEPEIMAAKFGIEKIKWYAMK